MGRVGLVPRIVTGMLSFLGTPPLVRDSVFSTILEWPPFTSLVAELNSANAHSAGSFRVMESIVGARDEAVNSDMDTIAISVKHLASRDSQLCGVCAASFIPAEDSGSRILSHCAELAVVWGQGWDQG